MKDIRNDLGRRLLLFDGALGTMLQAAGLGPGERTELWNFSHPEAVAEVHRQYAACGADVITANTFGANPHKAEDLA